MKNKALLPILFGFFIMGFCDVVGISTSYIKDDFQLSETLAGLIPSALFVWFLLLSIPSALMMNRIGRKTTVQLSNLITIVGLLIPFFVYSFTSCMVAFALLGIGNTMLQVSLNPLLANVVRGDTLTSSLTVGQIVKAISSCCGPFIALFAASQLGSWQYIFPIFGVITLLSLVWLQMTPIEELPANRGAGFRSTFALLGDSGILLCFLGIVAVVGLDVGMNTVTPKLLVERVGMTVEQAGLGSSVYFICRTCGAFFGAFLLARMSGLKYFQLNMLAVIASMVLLFVMQGQVFTLVMAGAIGFFASSIFAVLFAQAIKTRPESANEISGLMITGVCGGALIPPLMGVAADAAHSQVGSLSVISVCIAYLLFCSYTLKQRA